MLFFFALLLIIDQSSCFTSNIRNFNRFKTIESGIFEVNSPLQHQNQVINSNYINSKHKSTELYFIQAAFATTCAIGVFLYVAANIDEIKEKQRIATEAAITKQTSDIKSAQQQQQDAIKKAQAKQKEAIERGLKGK